MAIAFWIAVISLGLPVYSYFGYPVLLFLAASAVQTAKDAAYVIRRRERRSRAASLPSVSIIIAAYNEEASISSTLKHCLASDYPETDLEILVGCDGCSDGTAHVARATGGPRVRVFDFPERRGKISVISDLAARAKGEILVFTDANTRIDPDAVRNLARHFSDPDIGAVCGELRLAKPQGGEADEGLYWRYELVLKMLESRLKAVLGANGALYALRSALFPKVPPDIITDDFVIPMKVRAAGRAVIYDPEAVAVEDAPADVSAEFRRRLRIGAGNWQALGVCASLLLPWKGFVALAFWSHKILRWFTPLLLLTGFAANLWLLDQTPWRVAFAGQVAFYCSAALGRALRRMGKPAGPFKLPAYFAAINVALLIGLIRGALGLQKPAWQTTPRSSLPQSSKV